MPTYTQHTHECTRTYIRTHTHTPTPIDQGRGILGSHVGLLLLNRACVNNDVNPRQNFLNLDKEAEFDPYFYDLRLAVEMRAQGYLEGGLVTVRTYVCEYVKNM